LSFSKEMFVMREERGATSVVPSDDATVAELLKQLLRQSTRLAEAIGKLDARMARVEDMMRSLSETTPAASDGSTTTAERAAVENVDVDTDPFLSTRIG
jgi:small-conductance mechanosensitive channel